MRERLRDHWVVLISPPVLPVYARAIARVGVCVRARVGAKGALWVGAGKAAISHIHNNAMHKMRADLWCRKMKLAARSSTSTDCLCTTVRARRGVCVWRGEHLLGPHTYGTPQPRRTRARTHASTQTHTCTSAGSAHACATFHTARAHRDAPRYGHLPPPSSSKVTHELASLSVCFFVFR